MLNNNHLNEYELKALEYAEKVGIIDYEVEGNTMVFEEVLYEPNKTVYQEVRNLDTMELVSRRNIMKSNK